MDKVEQWADSRRGFGAKVDFHCPYDETTLRVDLTQPGYHVCPCCRTPFEAQEDRLPVGSDGWFMQAFKRIIATLKDTQP